MAFIVTFNGIELQPVPYARIKRLLDGKWWDQTGLQWVDIVSDVCNIVLIESSDFPGTYIGTAGFTSANGNVLAITVYDNTGVTMVSNTIIYKSDQMNALQIINEVQRQMRLPRSPLITEPHALLLLSYINEVQADYMMEFVSWDELKVNGSFFTRPGVSVYKVAPVNGGKVDSLRRLQVLDAQPMENLSDKDFSLFQKGNAAKNEPVKYRHFGRSGGGLLIEVSPVPDSVYQVDYELLQKPLRMVNAIDVPVLDEETIILGVKYLAIKDQGDDYTAELATFQSKLSLQGGSQSSSNNGDLEFL